MKMRPTTTLLVLPLLSAILLVAARPQARAQLGASADGTLLLALETLEQERATKAGDDPALFDETLAILDRLIASYPDAEAGLSARGVRMRLNRELGREEDSAADGTWLVTFHPDSWQAGWAHRELGVRTVSRAIYALESEHEELRAQAFDDLESGLAHLDLAVERAPLLTDEIWEPFAVPLAVDPHSRLGRVEGFEATPALWQATVYQAVWEWDSAAACYWHILDIVPGTHTANLARKYLENLIGAGLVAANASQAAPPLVSLRSALQGPHTHIVWNEVGREATVRGPQLLLSVSAGASAVRLNGAFVPLDQPARLVADRLMVPRTLFQTLHEARAVPDAALERLAALASPEPGR